MSQTIKGIVQNIETKNYTPKNSTIGPLVEFLLTVVTDDGESHKVSKSVKPENAEKMNLTTGTRVQVSFDETIAKGKDGQEYRNKKIINNGLVVFGGTSAQVTTSSNYPQSQTISPAVFKKQGGYDGDGAKRGNALSNGLTLALATKGKSVTEQDILTASRLMWRVSTELETPEQKHMVAENPKVNAVTKTLVKPSAPKSKTSEPINIDNYDEDLDESSPFD